jgi:hypothetical protein
VAGGGSTEVNLGELDRFAGSVAGVTSGMLEPGTNRVFSVYGAGATFGCQFNASYEILAARLKYHDALVSITTSLAGFINASRILVDAVSQVRARYAGTDTAAASSIAAVDQILFKAAADATTASTSTAPPPAPLLASDVSAEGGTSSAMGDPSDWQPQACTSWGKFTVPELWDMVKDTDDSGEQTFAQQRAWADTHDMLTDHAKALQNAKDDLLAVWPPSRSQAAAEFDEQVAGLLLAVRHYAGVAATNSGPTGGLAHTLISAKQRLRPIYEEWTRKETAQRNENALQKIGDAVGVTDPDAWRAPLQQQAIAVMVSTDEQVAQHRQQLQAPKPYSTFNPIQPVAEPADGGAGLGVGSGSGATTQDNWRTPPTISRPTIPPTNIGADDRTGTHSSSPELAGGAEPRHPTFVETSSGRSLAAGGVLGAVPSAVIGALGASAAVGWRHDIQPPINRTSTGIGSQPTPVHPSPGAPRAARMIGPGGVLGGTPEPLPGINGTPGRNGRASTASRLGRTGGVIGGQPNGDRGVQPMGASAASGRRRALQTEQRAGFDPDDPWAVEDGGPGVIEPNRAPTRHDPGSGVIGIDR